MNTTVSLPTAAAGRWSIARLDRNRIAIGLFAIGVIAAGLAWQWSWLVAVGAAPVLLSVAPCAAMCTLGLCMHRMGGRSCGASKEAPHMAQDDPGQTRLHLIAESTKET